MNGCVEAMYLDVVGFTSSERTDGGGIGARRCRNSEGEDRKSLVDRIDGHANGLR